MPVGLLPVTSTGGKQEWEEDGSHGLSPSPFPGVITGGSVFLNVAPAPAR